MVNALTRAHVGGPTPTPASAHLIAEKYPEPHDGQQTSGAAQSQSRKERRKQKRESLKEDTPLPEVIEPTKSSEHSDPESEDLPKDDPRPSRKERRKLAKQHKRVDSGASSELSQTSKPEPNPRSHIQSAPSLPVVQPSPSTMPPGTHFPLLVCSLGNPGPQYVDTLHSMGHTILKTLQHGSYEPWKKGMSGLYASPQLGAGRLTLLGFKKDFSQERMKGQDDFTLWQSQQFMNVCGPSVLKAWKMFSTQQRAQGLEPRLVVVHDELETAFGQINLREGKASPRGHNGLKSVQQALGATNWLRVGVGIGRPESRDPNVVSKYVLSKMTRSQSEKIVYVTKGVQEVLRKVSEAEG